MQMINFKYLFLSFFCVSNWYKHLREILVSLGVGSWPHFLCASGNKQSVCANTNKRAGNLIRPISPKSPGASASAFESLEGSDDDVTLPNDVKLDNSYLLTNGDIVSLCTCRYFLDAAQQICLFLNVIWAWYPTAAIFFMLNLVLSLCPFLDLIGYWYYDINLFCDPVWCPLIISWQSWLRICRDLTIFTPFLFYFLLVRNLCL